MKRRGISLLCVAGLVLWASAVRASNAPKMGDLKPMMAQPDKVLLKEDFSKPVTAGKDGLIQKQQGTTWAVKDGVLHGTESSKEYQDARKDHKGTEPRVTFPQGGQEFVVDFKFRIIGGKATMACPLIEFGHHSGRIAWPNGSGAKMFADEETFLLAEAPQFKLESGKWYHALAEVQGDELLVQFENGPTLYGKHDSLKPPKERPNFSIAGTNGGTVEIDDVTIWSVRPEQQPGWAAAKAKLPAPAAAPTGRSKKPEGAKPEKKGAKSQ